MLFDIITIFAFSRLVIGQTAPLSAGVAPSGRPSPSSSSSTWLFSWASGSRSGSIEPRTSRDAASKSIIPLISPITKGRQSAPSEFPSNSNFLKISSKSSGLTSASATNPGPVITFNDISATFSTSSNAASLSSRSSTNTPNRITVAPSGTSTPSNDVIFGVSLSSLSENIRGIDLTVPTVKARAIEDVKNTIDEADKLFHDLGGTDITNSCFGSRSSKRIPNPFSGLENLAGDIITIIGCADNVLNFLKTNLEEDFPDPVLIEALLDNLGTLADDTKLDDQPSSSASRNTASETASTRSDSSSASSSSQTSSSSGDICTSCCPTDAPALPTIGIPAVIAAPTDGFGIIDKRSTPERFHYRLAKRKPDVPIPKINNCILNTPNGWPVTTPAYPGGFEFYKSDIQGALGTLSAISRYYRSTTVGAPACTPTITRIDAKAWTFPQNGPGVSENDKVSVDHAYEIGFLNSFMNSIIDQPNGLTCKSANRQFFDNTGGCSDNRLQPIFGSLPSFDNPDFIVMSQWLNGDAKGWIFGPTFDTTLGGSFTPGAKVRQFDSFKDAVGKITNKMRLAQILVEAALIINADNTIAMMQKTNNRIYAAFQQHDTYLSQHPGLPQSTFGWANRYKTYMVDYFKQRNGASSRLLPGLLINIGTDLRTLQTIVKGKAQQSTFDQWNNLHNSISTYYGPGGNGASELNWSINWEFDTENVKRDEIEKIIDKRHVERRQACSRPISPSSADTPITTGPVTTKPRISSAYITPIAAKSSGSVPVSSSSAPFKSLATPPLVTAPPSIAVHTSSSREMVTYQCSTVSNQFGKQCKCGPFAEGQYPAYCPSSIVEAAVPPNRY